MKTNLILVVLLAGIGLLLSPLVTTAAPPVATTQAATGIGPANAILHGRVNPNGAAAAAYFQYGLTTNYDNLGGFTALPSTNGAITLPGLPVNSLNSPDGADWTLAPGVPVKNWATVASAADGQRLAAAAQDGSVYTSTNGGLTWNQSGAFTGFLQSMASSADGQRLAACGAFIYTSTNGGVTWTQTSAPNGSYNAIASFAERAVNAFGARCYDPARAPVWDWRRRSQSVASHTNFPCPTHWLVLMAMVGNLPHTPSIGDMGTAHQSAWAWRNPRAYVCKSYAVDPSPFQ
jgi:hypothetical protein